MIQRDFLQYSVRLQHLLPPFLFRRISANVSVSNSDTTTILEPILGVKQPSPYWACAVFLARWQLYAWRLQGCYYALLIPRCWQLGLAYWHLNCCETRVHYDSYSLLLIIGSHHWTGKTPALCRWHSTTSTAMGSSLVNQPISNRRAGYHLATYRTS